MHEKGGDNLENNKPAASADFAQAAGLSKP
jgi:hypothetical protein